jgi:hypothetical protein
MPLVVPGINSAMGDKSEWKSKLMGKKISDTGSNEIVSDMNIKHEASFSHVRRDF